MNFRVIGGICTFVFLIFVGLEAQAGSLNIESCYCTPAQVRSFCMGEQCCKGDSCQNSSYQGEMSIPQCIGVCRSASVASDKAADALATRRVKVKINQETLMTPKRTFSSVSRY